MTVQLQPKPTPPANDGHVSPLSADERLLRRAVQRALKAQVAEVHGRVEGGAKASAVPSSTRKWDEAVVREVRPIWFGLFKKGGDRALRNVRRFARGSEKMVVFSREMVEASERVDVKGRMVRSSSTDACDAEDSAGSTPALPSLKALPSIEIPEWIEDPEVLNALEREMFKFAHGIDQTTADALRDELVAGMGDGETISQLADRVSGLSDEWVEGWRSEMIARTETARAFSTGHIEAWRSTGVVDRKVWTAAGDACPFCQAMDGTVVELDENFVDRGDDAEAVWRGETILMKEDYSDVNGPPLHPNCRCVLVAELAEGKALKGGPGSGNFGHAGRPGEVGGSGPGGGGEVEYLKVKDPIGTTTSRQAGKLISSATKEIPKSHLVGVSGVSLNKSLTAKYNRTRELMVELGGKKSELPPIPPGKKIGGTFDTQTKEITVSLDIPRRVIQSFFAHEVGHNLYGKLSSGIRSEWSRYSRSVPAGKRISSYAGKDEKEHFSEAYSAYYFGGNRLSKKEPGAVEFFSSKISKKSINEFNPEWASGVAGMFEVDGVIYFLVPESMAELSEPKTTEGD